MVIKKYNLKKIILHDLLKHNLLQLILLFFIIINAISVIIITYETRFLTILKNNLYEEKDLLDIEWRNLIIEENLFGNHNRIERISIDKLSLIPIEFLNENIIILNNNKINNEIIESNKK
ncbi:cell division protein FtsL [Candidatus Providencia siddallii]|uniref:Cell division protein FtsL n=1 Tax=Candidatus Providencia siddallii TaxID=1715285 RepID=A0ABM9NP31_9GAMM